jgi:siroheme synthase-like protein
MAYLPIYLDVSARPCVVVGGGRVAERKVRALLEREALVTVINPAAGDAIAAQAAHGAIVWHRRKWRPGDLAGFALVFCAVEDRETSRAIAAEARALGIPVNVADRPELCTFVAAATVRRGDLQIAITTAGASPALAARIRERLERQFGPEYALSLVVMRAARIFLRRTGADAAERARRLGALADRDLAALIGAGDRAALERALGETVGADLAALGLAQGDLFEAAPPHSG